MIGWIAYGVLVLPIAFLAGTGRLLGTSPLSIGLQLAGFGVMVWARIAFGGRSFHAGSTPTAGGLVTSGPYRFVRHPIYLAALLVLAGAVVAHHDVAALVAAAVAVVALAVRIISEEREVATRYPEYVDYARRTRRLIPWIF